MLAIDIGNKRPLWEMRAGGVGVGANIKAAPTLAPRALLGGGEKLLGQ